MIRIIIACAVGINAEDYDVCEDAEVNGSHVSFKHTDYEEFLVVSEEHARSLTEEALLEYFKYDMSNDDKMEKVYNKFNSPAEWAAHFARDPEERGACLNPVDSTEYRWSFEGKDYFIYIVG